MFIIAAASVFGWLVTINQVAVALYHAILAITTQKWLILLFINAILLFLGCFIEGIAIMIVSIPALIPLMKSLQVDLVHFGVVLTIAIMIGLITPWLRVRANTEVRNRPRINMKRLFSRIN